MCGIVGIASPTGERDVELLHRMRDSMEHRGPDAAGAWWSADGRVGLGHRRLAIIDLSPGGCQPMADIAGELRVTFNGEIYNYRELREQLAGHGHRFRTASDTEVLLEAYRRWGTDCLTRLNGMFAFALYDERQRRLFIARDRAGEKPLFYHDDGRRLVFASELKALLCNPTVPRELDLNSLDHFLAFAYVPGDMCLLRGVHKLPQGHAMTYDLTSGASHTWAYWTLPEPAPSGLSTTEMVDELERLLLDSVRHQLVADVPVGVLLSGGIDSSLVTAAAAKVSAAPVKTYTVSFPGHGTFDEGPYARIVADHFGTEHTELVAEPASVDLLPALARQYDEPIADSSMVPTFLVSRLIRASATVALGGDGGDELFGGYTPYSWILQQERVRRFVPRRIRQAVGSVAARGLPVGLRGRNYIIGFTADLPRSIAHLSVYFDEYTRRRLLAPVADRIGTHGSAEEYRIRLCRHGRTPLQQMTTADFMSYLVDDILVKVDRASMLTSLEVRAPWLDYRIIEFAFGRVPDVLRATTTERKILPRLLGKRLLPPALDLSRKQGFSLPLASWLRSEWGRFFEEVLQQVDERLFDRATVMSLLEGQRRGRSNSQRLFALTIFELWRREYGITLPA